MNNGPLFSIYSSYKSPKEITTTTSSLIKMKKLKKEMENLIMNQAVMDKDESPYKEERIFSYINGTDSDRENTNSLSFFNSKDTNNIKGESRMNNINHKFKLNLSNNTNTKTRSIFKEDNEKYNKIKKKIVQQEFTEKHSKSNKYNEKTLLKILDLDESLGSLGGKFTSKFTNGLKENNNNLFKLSQNLNNSNSNTSINRINSSNKNDMSQSSDKRKYSEFILPIIKEKEIDLLLTPKYQQSLSSEYSHQLHLKQKYINHKKLFKNQDDLKGIYTKMSNMKSGNKNNNGYNKLKLVGISNTTLRDNERIQTRVKSIMSIRRKK